MLNVAVIGAGNIARAAHLPAWRAQPDARVTLLVDTRREIAEALGREFEIPRVATAYQEALSDPAIDAVDICLPHHLHQEVALAALAAGKHVLKEKPVALDLAAARDLIAAARTAPGMFMLAENWRYMPVVIAAADLIRSGAPGRPFMLKAAMEFYAHFEPDAWRLRRAEAGGGVLLDSGIHTVAVARMLMGEVAAVSALRGPQVWQDLAPSEDTLGMLARFASGALGLLDFSWRARWPQSRFSFEVFTTESHLSLDLKAGTLAITRGSEREERAYPPSSGFAEEVRHFLDCLRDGGRPLTTALEETRSLAVVLAAYRSVESGRVERPEPIENDGP